MADILTGIKALSPSQAAVTAVAAAGGDINGMLAEAQVRTGELLKAVNSIIVALPSGDATLTTLGAQIASLIPLGQFVFNVNTNSGLIATINMG